VCGRHYVKAHVNILAFSAAIGVYLLLAVPFGLAVLGVGFAPEPQRTIGSYIILLAPLVPAGFVGAYLAKLRPFSVAAAVAVFALLVFWVLAPGPMPWFMVNDHSNVAVAAQGIYQSLLYVVAASVGGWAGTTIRRRRT
jgi:hypothetical protein